MRLVFRTILNETCPLPMSSGEISNETEYDVTCWKDSPTLYAAVRKSIISVGSLMWGRTESCRMTSTFLYMLMGNCRKTKILVKQHSTLYTRGQNSRLMSNYESFMVTLYFRKVSHISSNARFCSWRMEEEEKQTKKKTKKLVIPYSTFSAALNTTQLSFKILLTFNLATFQSSYLPEKVLMVLMC